MFSLEEYKTQILTIMFFKLPSITGRQPASSRTDDLSTGGLTAVVVSFIFTFLATIAVGLRFWVRRIKRVGVLVEDWLIVAALVCSTGLQDSSFNV